jgi:hypothetical protein
VEEAALLKPFYGCNDFHTLFSHFYPSLTFASMTRSGAFREVLHSGANVIKLFTAVSCKFCNMLVCVCLATLSSTVFSHV